MSNEDEDTKHAIAASTAGSIGSYGTRTRCAEKRLERVEEKLETHKSQRRRLGEDVWEVERKGEDGMSRVDWRLETSGVRAAGHSLTLAEQCLPR